MLLDASNSVFVRRLKISENSWNFRAFFGGISELFLDVLLVKRWSF